MTMTGPWYACELQQQTLCWSFTPISFIHYFVHSMSFRLCDWIDVRFWVLLFVFIFRLITFMHRTPAKDLFENSNNSLYCCSCGWWCIGWLFIVVTDGKATQSLIHEFFYCFVTHTLSVKWDRYPLFCGQRTQLHT